MSSRPKTKLLCQIFSHSKQHFLMFLPLSTQPPTTAKYSAASGFILRSASFSANLNSARIHTHTPTLYTAEINERTARTAAHLKDRTHPAPPRICANEKNKKGKLEQI